MNFKTKFLLLIIGVFALSAIFLRFYELYPKSVVGFSSEGLRERVETLRISRKGLDYIWESNGNIVLKKFDTSHKQNGVEVKSTFFVNPEGKGFIVVRHNRDDVIFFPNFTIYLLDHNQTLTSVQGTTRGTYPPKLFKSFKRGPI